MLNRFAPAMLPHCHGIDNNEIQSISNRWGVSSSTRKHAVPLLLVVVRKGHRQAVGRRVVVACPTQVTC